MNTPLNDAPMSEFVCGDCGTPLMQGYTCGKCDSFSAVTPEEWNTRANTPDSAAQGAMGDRERFESTLKKKRGFYEYHFERNDDGTYSRDHVEGYWHIWQLAQPSDATAQPTHWTQEMLDQVADDVERLSKKIVPGRQVDEVAQPRVDLTDEREAFEIVRAALPKFSLVEGDWLIRAVKVGPYQDVEEAEAIHIDTINTIIRALLANTTQGKPEHIGDSYMLDWLEDWAVIDFQYGATGKTIRELIASGKAIIDAKIAEGKKG